LYHKKLYRKTENKIVFEKCREAELGVELGVKPLMGRGLTPNSL